MLPDGTVYETLELPWKNNKTRTSCIPEGEYNAAWHLSPKFGWTYKIFNVPGRSEILFHAGNYPSNTLGCILLGKSSTADRVWGSKPAVQGLANKMRRSNFRLRIFAFLDNEL